MKSVLSLAFVSLIFMSCSNGNTEKAQTNKTPLLVGDIIFQDLDCGPFCDAIEAVTYGVDSLDFSHCGIIAKDSNNNLIVLEAISKGVSATPLNDVLNRTQNSKVYIGRINNESVNLDEAINIAYSKLGAPYDDVFDITNDKYYCSELTYEAYRDKHGDPIFKLYPMTYKEPNTDDFYSIWVDYFDNLNSPIPEKEPGLNPGSISRSEFLEFHTFKKSQILP